MECFTNSNGAFLKISTLKNNKVRMVIIPEETEAKGWSDLYNCLSGVLKRKPGNAHDGVKQQKEVKIGECRMNSQSWANIVKRSGQHVTKPMGGNVVKQMEKPALKIQHNKDAAVRNRGKVEWRELYPEINLGFKPKNLYPEKRFYQPKFYEYMCSKAQPKDWSLAIFLARDNTHADWSTIFFNLSRELERKLIVSQLFDDRCITWCKDEKEKEEKIGDMCGGLMDVDKDTAEASVLSHLRLQLMGDEFGLVPETLSLNHDDRNYELKLFKLNDLSYRFHGWFNTCWYQDFDNRKANLDNCVILAYEKENRECSTGEIGSEDDIDEDAQVECEVAAADGGEGGPVEEEKPEQRKIEDINEITRTDVGSRLSRFESHGITIPKVGKRDDWGTINIQHVYSRILHDLNRPSLKIPHTCPFNLIRDTCTPGGITAQMDLGPRIILGRKGLDDNSIFESNIVLAGDNRERGPLIYYHNGPFNIFLAHKRIGIRPEIKSPFNLKIQRMDPWASKGKEKMAICVKKNPEQIINDFFEGRLKSITPKSQADFRAATIMFWADFEVIKKTKLQKIRVGQESLMKILSWNIRGSGDKEKRRAIKATICKATPDMVILQEVKKEDVDRRFICSIWRSRFKAWILSPAIGRFGAHC
uniref:Endonuclease/exonuclease/phosphatase domain-containing protein n=1 Tax=Cannabis sativa TaxID=3483 RepID=A0A803QNG8_CANSA